jgi:hypothetical protein
MAHGPGAYDDFATLIREQTQAEGVMVIVVGGNRGQGFSAQLPPELMATIPAILRDMAKQIEDDYHSKLNG